MLEPMRMKHDAVSWRRKDADDVDDAIDVTDDSGHTFWPFDVQHESERPTGRGQMPLQRTTHTHVSQ